MSSRLGYRLAGLSVVVAIVGSFGWYLYAVSATTWQVNEFTRGRLTGTEVDLDAGDHTVWVEAAGISARRHPAEDFRRVLTLRATAANGSPIAVASIRSEVFNTGSIEGRSLWVIEVVEPGLHVLRIDITYDLEVQVPLARNLAVSEGRGLKTPIWPYAGWIFVGGLSVSVAIVTIVWWRGRRDLRAFLANSDL